MEIACARWTLNTKNPVKLCITDSINAPCYYCHYLIGAKSPRASEKTVAYGKIIQPETFERHLEAVTPEDIRTLARQLFAPHRFSLALISPETSRDALLAELARLD